MFGIRIVTSKSLRRLENSLRIEQLEVFKSHFKEFTADVVECIQNNLQGFADTLARRPCKYHSKEMEALQEKYGRHDDQIKDHEKRIEDLEKEVFKK